MMKDTTIKIAICDDLVEERIKIIAYLQKYVDIRGYYITIDEYENGEELLASNVNKYNLIILDIFMNELNGIEVAREIMTRSNHTPVIFCSTSNEFAEESYDVNAFRYLTKPVDEERFYQTLDKFFNTQTSLRMISFKQNRMDESIYLAEVLWIEAGDHKSIIHTRSGDITTTTIFKQFCAELEDADFIKPIRFALVALDAIEGIPGEDIKLIDGTIIGVSRDMRKEVKRAYTDYKMKKLLKKGGVL